MGLNALLIVIGCLRRPTALDGGSELAGCVSNVCEVRVKELLVD